MSQQFQLVSAIIARAARQAGIQGQDDRHTAAEQLAQFNASAGELRVRLTNLGFEWFLERLATASLPTTAAASGETYAEIDWPLAAQRIYRIDVLFQTDLWLPLKMVSIGGLRDFQRFRNLWDVPGISDGPCAFALRKAPFNTTNSETVGKIMIAPVPRTARSYTMFYLANFSDMASTDTYNGHASFIEWIVQDMVCKYSEVDNDSNSTYQIAMLERQRLEALFASEAPKTQQAHADVPRRSDFSGDWGWEPTMVP
jgi:hypothetical protein